MSTKLNVLTLDFETFDPYIKRKMGSGWVYGMNVPGSDFKVLGASLLSLNEGRKEIDSYIANNPGMKDYIKEHINKAELLVMHNASYDLGCLSYLGIDIGSIPVFDTMIAAKLYDSTLMSYSLDNLANRYLGYQKGNDLLAQAALDAGIYPHTKKYITEKTKGLDPSLDMKKVVTWCKENMDQLQEHCTDALAEYACIDTDLTYRLYEFFKDNVDMDTVLKYSSLPKITNSYRSRGVRVDLDAAQSAKRFLDIEIMKATDKMHEIALQEFNVSSPKEVTEVLHERGLKCPKTSIGNPSATASWLESQEDELCRSIIATRKLMKIRNDFIGKIIDMQEHTCPHLQGGRYGRLFPHLNVMGANTGRFSCEAPNIQQIPSRDENLAPLCRGLFVAEEGERLFSLDYANQEGRLQIHYAYNLRCDGSSEVLAKFLKNPMYDLHQQVANLMGVDRSVAKAINLGLSYGMGIAKMASSLGITVPEAKYLRDEYYRIVPFMRQLNDKCQDVLKTRGYIKTIGGRHLGLGEPVYVDGERKTFEYKALNMLIQGSAADQTIEAMIQAHNKGIKVLFPVHDQLLMSGTKEEALELKRIMENCIKLSVPVVVDMKEEGGKSWLDAGH
jgi:DNA polymerase-1